MAVHTINMSPSRPLGPQIPQELRIGSKLRISGCEVYALITKDDRGKLGPRSMKCIFLGYGLDGEFGYQLWDPDHKQIIRSSDVVFNELAMHKTAESPIEFRRVTFLDVSILHDGPAHNTRSASRVAETSSTNSAAPDLSELWKTCSATCVENMRNNARPQPSLQSLR